MELLDNQVVHFYWFMPSYPLVTVIALCFEHEQYVIECLESVLAQTYPHLELIVVDNGSHDNSPQKIQDFIQPFPFIRFIQLTENIGNCRAFNLALAQSTGKYVMDLATDDRLESDCIENQVFYFEKLSSRYGVVFGNAYLIDQKGKKMRTFYAIDQLGKVQKKVPDGNIYAAIVAHSFICTPTMLFRREMLEEMGGYDESLSYEDFDCWVRSSRYWYYFFIDKILISKRLLTNSHGESFYLPANPHLHSTLRVCQKAFLLNQNETENKALAQRVRFHVRLCFYTESFGLVEEFAALLEKLDQFNYLDRVIVWLSRQKIRLRWAYQLYRKLRIFLE